MEFEYLNCGLKNEEVSDHRTSEHYFGSSQVQSLTGRSLGPVIDVKVSIQNFVFNRGEIVWLNYRSIK